MQLFTGDLGATKTYAARDYVWVGRTDPADLRDGTLTVNTTKGTTGRAKVESRRYQVQEVPAEDGTRVFMLVKADGEVYETVLGDRGPTCTCKAASCKVDNCVHRDALAALVEAGAFDPPIDPPAAPPVTEAEIDDMAEAHESQRSGLWFPPEPPADDDLPECFRGCGSYAGNCPF